jgi:hypothetical protein
MLFILVMDVPGHMVSKATEEGILQSLARQALQHRISHYADDVVFICPETTGIATIMDVLNLFGVASWLKTNLQKSNVLPIRCEEHGLEVVQHQLHCALVEFPCKYLGLPHALKKLKKEHIQPFDRMVDQLSGLKADLLTRVGRKVHVQFVLTSMLIYLAMALDFPQWPHKALDKIRQKYFWRGHKEEKGEHCLVACDTVCHPTELSN